VKPFGEGRREFLKSGREKLSTQIAFVVDGQKKDEAFPFWKIGSSSNTTGFAGR
jgi:hypothetical protein